MEVIKLRPGIKIRNPLDPLGPPLGIVADGFASIVLATRSDEPLEKLADKARTIRRLQRAARKGGKAAIDRRAKRRKNSE